MKAETGSKAVLEALILQRMKGALKSLAAAGVEVTDITYRTHPVLTGDDNTKMAADFKPNPSITEED